MAKVLAKSVKGHEFLYDARSARMVSDRSAERICEIANSVRYLLKDNEVWHVHEVDRYDRAYDYAQFQKFTIRNGLVKDVRY